MSDNNQHATKEEMIEILQESIKHLQSIPVETIDKRKTRMNTSSGTGYYFSDEKFHLWVVKID